MSIPKKPARAKAFMSILSARWDEFWPGLKDELRPRFGEVDFETEPIPFTQTKYYDRELGTPIYRKILTFLEPIDQDSLAGLKLFTNGLENKYASGESRLFNLDPGMVTLERLVLATGKNFIHRIYLGEGIWADLTLIFHKGGWMTLPWTFPDYAEDSMKEVLSGIRNRYKEQCF